MPEDLWLAVAERVAKSEEGYARKTGGSFFAKASKADYVSPYLMSGFIKCACGGSIGGQVALHGNGPAAERTEVLKYGCALRKNRGNLACANSLTLKAETLDATILMALRTIIAPDMMAEAVERALVVLTSGQDTYGDRRVALETKVKEAEAKTARLVAAVGAGGAELQPLLDGLKAVEAEKAYLRTELAKMPPVPPVLDTDEIVTKVKAHAADLVGLLAVEHGPKVRALLRKLIPTPLIAEPIEQDGR